LGLWPLGPRFRGESTVEQTASSAPIDDGRGGELLAAAVRIILQTGPIGQALSGP